MRILFLLILILIQIGAGFSEDCESVEVSIEVCSQNEAFKLKLPGEGQFPDLRLCSSIAYLVKTCTAN
jgi:hypothetical protein